MTSSSVMRSKGVDDYTVNEVVRFVMEVGRSGGLLQPGILQSDQETAMRALLCKAGSLLNMNTRYAPYICLHVSGS